MGMDSHEAGVYKVREEQMKKIRDSTAYQKEQIKQKHPGATYGQVMVSVAQRKATAAGGGGGGDHDDGDDGGDSDSSSGMESLPKTPPTSPQMKRSKKRGKKRQKDSDSDHSGNEVSSNKTLILYYSWLFLLE